MKTNCLAKNEAPPKYTLKPSKAGGWSAITKESPAEIDKMKDLTRKVQALDNEERDALLQAMLEELNF